MQYSIFALAAIVAVAVASATPENFRLAPRQSNVQSSTNGVPLYKPAMTDKSGNVVAFNPATVYLAGVAQGK